jgi:hypothetical protein
MIKSLPAANSLVNGVEQGCQWEDWGRIAGIVVGTPVAW